MEHPLRASRGFACGSSRRRGAKRNRLRFTSPMSWRFQSEQSPVLEGAALPRRLSTGTVEDARPLVIPGANAVAEYDTFSRASSTLYRRGFPRFPISP